MQVKAGAIKTWIMRTLAAGGLLAVMACAPVFRNHGYVPPETDLEQIKVGSTSRQEVADLIGRPTAEALLNDTGWYYVQSRFRHYGALPPKEIERQVVAVTFSDKDVVENVERFGLEDGKVVALSRRVTETNIKGVSFLRQLFSSFGRIRAEDIVQ